MFESLRTTVDELAADPPRAVLLIRAEGRAVSGGVNVDEFDGADAGAGAELWDELIGVVEKVERCRCRSSSPPTR